MSELLKGLDSIDWKSLNAPLVPKWLRNLASDDVAAMRDAFDNLETQVVFRGAPPSGGYGPIEELFNTEVPYLIVPFLMELLEEPHIKNKDGIMELLFHLARNVQINIGKLDENHQLQALRLFQMIQSGIPLYKGFYEKPDNFFMRQAAHDLLITFDESH